MERIICPLNPTKKACTTKCVYFPRNHDSQTAIRNITGLPQAIVENQIERALDRAVDVIKARTGLTDEDLTAYVQSGLQPPPLRGLDCADPDNAPKT